MAIRTLAIAALALALGLPAEASIIKGGITFDDNAFVDAVVAQSGSFSTSGGSLADVMTDLDEGTWAFSFSPGAFATLGFTDNVLVNGAGADLAVFEVGTPELFALTVGGVTRAYTGVYAGYQAGAYNVNIAQIDLDDFGLAPGATFNDVTLSFEAPQGGDVPDYSLVGAINSSSVPEPVTLALFGTGLLGFGFRRRR